MAKTYSESDMGSMVSYGKSIGVHAPSKGKPTPAKRTPAQNKLGNFPKKPKSPKNANSTQMFNKKRVATAANKMFP
jgi:hypothetical protein